MPEHRTLRAAFFDLDGTLLDTLQDLADSMNLALSHQGLPTVAEKEFRMLVGTGASELARLASRRACILSGRTQEQAEEHSRRIMDEILIDFQGIYAANWNRSTKRYEGIQEALSSLAVSGVPMAVLSNKPHSFTRRIVTHYFPDIPFESVCGQREGISRKPDPSAADEALEAVGIPVGDIAYLGDSGTDMHFAVRTGFLPVGVLWGFRRRDELIEAGAELLLESPLMIPDLFREER